MMRIDHSLTDGVDPLHIQPTSTAPKKYPKVKGLSGSMIRKESALRRKGICFFAQRQKKKFVTFWQLWYSNRDIIWWAFVCNSLGHQCLTTSWWTIEEYSFWWLHSELMKFFWMFNLNISLCKIANCLIINYLVSIFVYINKFINSINTYLLVIYKFKL